MRGWSIRSGLFLYVGYLCVCLWYSILVSVAADSYHIVNVFVSCYLFQHIENNYL